MEASVFVPSSRMVENTEDYNELPDAYQRRGTYWNLVSKLLGVPQRYDGIDTDYVDPAILRMRQWEALRQPPRVTVADLVSEAGTHVADAIRETLKKIKPTTKTEAAATWLREVLSKGPLRQTDVVERGIAAGFSNKVLKDAKKRAKVVSSRNGRSNWLWRLSVNVVDDKGTA
jgi:hypothetical protein